MGAAIELVEMREPTPEAVQDVARVMAECEAYYRAVQGHPADPSEVESFFKFEVPGIAPEDVRAYGIRVDGRTVGLASMVLGWKRPGQSMIGLLAVADRHRGRGYARAAFDALAAVARASPHGQSLRIGVVESNAQAFGFWHHLGFVETGERKCLADFVAEVVLLEKPLDG
jgi:ribosomal protein S18 acetylase RimI-like enzyme